MASNENIKNDVNENKSYKIIHHNKITEDPNEEKTTLDDKCKLYNDCYILPPRDRNKKYHSELFFEDITYIVKDGSKLPKDSNYPWDEEHYSILKDTEYP